MSSLKSIFGSVRLNNITVQYYEHTDAFQYAPVGRVVCVWATSSVSLALAGDVPANSEEQRHVSCYSWAEGANLGF